ncbi:hypothetical protein MHU86_17412 [Fragilaria crotonensis]|nr:hypothetical protein MHU86_17412 [Fragilaria crotonensis]
MRVQQEMDALYGPFKSSTYARGEKVVQQKLSRGLARRNGKVPPAVLNLDFNDLATVVNGTPDDEPRNKPFDSIFTEEKILRSWAKVGFVPFTRNCLKDKKVRKELGQRKADEQLENLQRRAETEDKQAEELVENGKAFSVAGQWNHCQSRIGNAGVTIRAQKMQLELNETARTKVANKKSEAQLKALEKAQIALAKFEFDSHSMNDKDWGDVIRWVLPEAKVEFLLKDLKKKEDILAKLATLPNSWTTYIPRREHTLPAVPTTTV